MILEETTDGELVVRAKSGDTSAFEELYFRHRNKAMQIATRFVGTEAEDLTQEAFLNAYKGLPKFREQASFSTWLFRIVFNLGLMKVRKKKRVVSEANVIMEDGSSYFDMLPSSEPSQEFAPDRALTEVALSRIPVKYRQVMLMYFAQQLEMREIARRNGTSLSQVKSEVNRGRKMFKAKYAELTAC